MLQVTEANSASSTKGILGKIVISESSVICHPHDPTKSIWNYQIVPHITKILQTFESL